jgi:anti-sigma factor RsiW
MKRLCDLFNRHRDGMLDEEQKLQFESHLAACDECRTRLMLLNNLVHLIRDQEIADQAARSEQIAERAYEQSDAWDTIFLFWLRPAQAWSVLAVLLILLSSLWVGPFAQQPTTGNEYGSLLAADDQAVSSVASLPDAEFEIWLEKGGNAK